MADTEKKFSELNSAGTLDGTEILAMSQTVSGSLMSVKDTLQAIANWFAINSQYTSALNTTSKTLTGAINELKQLISLIPQFSIAVVQTLPTEDISDTTIYLVPSSNPETENAYDEFIHVNNTWEQVGSTAVDLSAYYTKLETDAKYPVTFTNVAASSTTTKKVADVTQNSVTTSLYADDTEAILRKVFGEHTVEGNPVTFDAYLGLETVKSLSVTMNPIQSGTGDPSPTNIRPISGRDSLVLNVSGTNIWNEEWEVGGYNVSTGAKNLNTDKIRCKNLVSIVPNTTYYKKSPSPGIYWNLYYDKEKNYLGYSGSGYNATFTTPSNAYYMAFSTESGYGTTYNNDISINYPSTDTAYHKSEGNTTYTITFPSTVYGGTDEVVGGTGTETWGYIASYNGETLTGRWISDRDVYAEGTTPTTGAEVCYELSTPTTFSTTPTPIGLNKGINVVSSDADDLELTYSVG